MSARKTLIGASTALLLCLAALLPAAAAAAAKPAWTLTLTPLPANLIPGGKGELLAIATNVGGAPTTGTSTVEVALPAGVVPLEAKGQNSDVGSPNPPCAIDVPTRTAECKTTEPIEPGRRLMTIVNIETSAPEGTLDLQASVEGGSAQQSDLTYPAPVKAQPIPFDFLPGFQAPTNNADGSATVLAGSHPYQQTVDFGFPTEEVGEGLTNDGHARNFHTELPRGLLGSPAATPVLCTELELIEGNCPNASQVGVTDVTTLLGVAGFNAVFTSNLYNMVPPPGYPAALGTNVANAGIFVHILASLRSDGDYGIETSVKDTIAFGLQPIFNVQAQIWGQPSAEVHDPIRGKCTDSENLCPVTHTETALLTMPGDCPAEPLRFEMLADSWEEPSPPAALRETAYESADLQANPVTLEGCEALEYEPTISARPTTNLADSPTGLDFDLHQPQRDDFESRATAGVKDATVTFPAGLAVNPAQAAGLGACSEAQIGFQGEQEGRLSFSRAPQSCPDAAKIGTLQVSSPALVRHNATHEVELDPETKEPLPEVLKGSVYVATPFANPFDSLIATYLVVEDKKTGIVAKLAGEAQLDPATGQITASFKENPELPLEDVAVHLFGGERGALITPPVCGKYTTTAALVPWSASDGEAATERSDSFQLSGSPGGGACPTTEAAMPNAAKLSAGTTTPKAGAFSPLIFKVSREDGTQRLGRIEADLPVGLSAKLAGIAQCPDADIARARAREAPNQGAAEIADPSCPASSEVGTVIAAAGAGPNPYYTTGHAYLSGPYMGAPLSVVAIVPAVAGPFDLGTVVARSALYLNPETAQAHILTDPLPQILEGVPVDARVVSVSALRPNFTLNPTSCDEKAFGANAISALGNPAPLFERFQVGGCKSLPYKPKLSARLFGPIHRGGHPRFRAVLTARPGEANTGAFSLTLPRSEFIDQAHFRTICTRVQFAASQCPAGSVYGYVKAKSPLVDYTLQGPIYLRSSSHELPDAVAVLHGPPSQPIEIDAVARIDSVGGGLRSRVQTVPDAPISKVIVTLLGAKKGLFQNSTNICKGTFRMRASFTGQNAKTYDTKPKLNAQCAGKGGKGKGRR